jgi:hypothetical protein
MSLNLYCWGYLCLRDRKYVVWWWRFHASQASSNIITYVTSRGSMRHVARTVKMKTHAEIPKGRCHLGDLFITGKMKLKQTWRRRGRIEWIGLTWDRLQTGCVLNVVMDNLIPIKGEFLEHWNACQLLRINSVPWSSTEQNNGTLFPAVLHISDNL